MRGASIAVGAGHPVLVTRPEPGASATAARLVDLGFRPVLAPLLSVETYRGRLPDPETICALLIASQQALPALPEGYHALPLFAVGDATAAAALRAGFADVRSAGGRAEDLAALVIDTLPRAGGTLLLATGRGQGLRLQTILCASGFSVRREEVYAAHSVTALPSAAEALFQSCAEGWILLFSRETALCFLRLMRAGRLTSALARFSLAAISEPVAEVVASLPWRQVRVAFQPTETAVLALLHD